MLYLYQDVFEDDEEDLDARTKFSWFVGRMAYYTTLLAMGTEDLFVPYYFDTNYNILEKIAERFDMDLPEIPLKKDYEGRFFHYANLCKSFHVFMQEHDMNRYEFCAFLYDFAPKAVGGIDSYIIKDIPDAKGAYFIGSAQDDIFLSYDEGVITSWQCNPDTMAGDAIVMYLTSPVSALDSVWRSVSVGFNDPFSIIIVVPILLGRERLIRYLIGR